MSSQRLIIPVEKVWHQLEHASEKGRHQIDHVSEGSIKLTFSIRDLESPYNYPEASESASPSDDETPHDDYSEVPNPESSTLPQDETPLSQDGVIEQAQGDDGESWEDGLVARQDDSEEVDTGEGLSLEARTPEYHDCMETVDRSSASAAVGALSSNSPDRQLNIKQRQKQGQYQKIHRFGDNTGAIWRKKLQQWQLPQLHMLTLTRPLAGNSGAKQKKIDFLCAPPPSPSTTGRTAPTRHTTEK